MRSILYARAPRRWAEKVAAAGPTWRRLAGQTARKQTRPSRRSPLRSVDECRVFVVQRCTDVARAREIHAFTQAIFGALDIDPPSGVLKETEANFAARLRDETCFVVEEGGLLIASMFCRRDGDALYVGRLAVAPQFRRQGIANALVDAAKAE